MDGPYFLQVYNTRIRVHKFTIYVIHLKAAGDRLMQELGLRIANGAIRTSSDL